MGLLMSSRLGHLKGQKVIFQGSGAAILAFALSDLLYWGIESALPLIVAIPLTCVVIGVLMAAVMWGVSLPRWAYVGSGLAASVIALSNVLWHQEAYKNGSLLVLVLLAGGYFLLVRCYSEAPPERTQEPRPITC